MPDQHVAAAAWFRQQMSPFLRAAGLTAVARAMVVAAAATALFTISITLAGSTAMAIRLGAAGVFLIVTSAAAIRWIRQLSLVGVAADLERRAGGLDNILVTAAEAAIASRRPLHPIVADEVWRAARERLAKAAAHRPGILGPMLGAAACVIAVLFLAWSLPHARPVNDRFVTASPAGSPTPLTLGDVRVHVTPPPYAGREPASIFNPQTITVLEGSQVRLEVAAPDDGVRLVDGHQGGIVLTRAGAVWTHAFAATASRVLLLQPRGGGQVRALQVRVDPDRRPIVRIQVPGRDLVVPNARGQLPIAITAEDDLALASLVLRYTRVAGSGESFTFEEGEAPITIQRESRTSWQARGTLSLNSLKLEEGDTLVYRAQARDGVPGRDPSASDTFIVEVGRLAGVAATGFAIPEERDRQAISQQMVIVKTERLHADRAMLDSTTFIEQSRLLAIEQRMVRAEFVFMTGGHVEDEVAEAEAGHEIAEGRLENEGQVELLTAIREMSRAEARLNDGDTVAALTFERAALRALQRAFDRRRYLLRTLPERTRIDASRRLTGDRQEARGNRQPAVTHQADAVVVAARDVLAALGAVNEPVSGTAALAARILAVHPESLELQQAAVKLASAADRAARRAAVEDAQRTLVAMLQSRLGTPPRGRVSRDPLGGRLGDALRASPR